jgi:hypothetical protein
MVILLKRSGFGSGYGGHSLYQMVLHRPVETTALIRTYAPFPHDTNSRSS